MKGSFYLLPRESFRQRPAFFLHEGKKECFLLVAVIPPFPSVVPGSRDSGRAGWFSHQMTQYVEMILCTVFLGKVLSALTSSRGHAAQVGMGCSSK